MTSVPESSKHAGPTPFVARTDHASASWKDPAWLEGFRAKFPSLSQKVHGHPLAYLDNAATTQKPQVVLDTIQEAYVLCSGNVHRGVHQLSARATTRFEAVRRTAQRFLNAKVAEEIVFTHGTTESINLVAHSYAETFLKADDEILITELEHHANIVPWQQAAKKVGAKLVVAPIDVRGDLDVAAFQALLSSKTRLVAISQVSNALGTVLPVSNLIQRAKQVGAKVLVDGAQAVSHGPVNVQALDCDFYVFSGHKVFGPTGVGILWGKKDLLDTMPPYQTGGGMIALVRFEETTFAQVPQRFEAGTPAVSEVLGLGAALEFTQALDWKAVEAHEKSLVAHARARLAEVPGLSLVGDPSHQVGAISFTMDCAHPHDIGTVLDTRGIAVRSGHHCAQPLMHKLGLVSTARASVAAYNTHAEIEALAQGLTEVHRMFAGGMA